ncbi:MAG TPA: glycoside hydrolase family 43 protein [Deinococcales bacterium]|nr:glycoside hydrolase family 43 protein [Deinococcales bacterium]
MNRQLTPAQSTPAIRPALDLDFPDPFVLATAEGYFAFATNARGLDVQVAFSPDLATWELRGNALAHLPPWALRGFTWAPEVMAVDGGYVMYYVARHATSGLQCIGAAFSTRPEGPYRDSSVEPLISQLELGGAIDPSPFVEEDGSRYLLWKNDGNAIHKETVIWARRLSDDGRELTGETTALIRNDTDWEGNLVEAPFAYRHGGRYYLFYSAADYNASSYAVGYAVSEALLGPYRKPASPSPILATSKQLAGPGGQCVVTDGHGTPWMVYHAWRPGAVGYPRGKRRMYVSRLTFPNGTPRVTLSEGPATRAASEDATLAPA